MASRRPLRWFQFSLARLVGTGTLVAVLLATFLRISPDETARQHCIQVGWQEGEFYLTRKKWPHVWPVLRTAEVEFTAPAKRQKLRLELRQSIGILPWKVVHSEELEHE